MQSVKANGGEFPALGLGTWTLRDEVASKLVTAALEAGYRHVDTAIMYENEAAVGAGIAASAVPRDEIFITTKIWPTDLGRGKMEAAMAGSLERLGLEAVDLVLIHWPPQDVPLAEAIEGLNAIKAAGQARHIGVSNFTTRLLDEAVELSQEPLFCNQVEYHPYLNQDRVLAACRDKGMALVSYCPLARGEELFREEVVRQAAQRLGKTPAQVILRWHVQQEGVVAIPRTSNPDRLAENAAVFDFALEAEEMAAISALGQRGMRICDFEFSPQWDEV